MRLCPLCQSDRSDRRRSDDLLYTVATGQTIHCCNDCGMVYADNTPVIDYAANSTYGSLSSAPDKTAHYEQIVANCLRAGVTRDKSVLDIGCGAGGLMKAFLAAGFRTVHGLSVSAAEVDACNNRGLTVLHRDVENIGLCAPYDLVALSHVLEHVPEPIPFLRAVRRWIKPTGSLYVETPNALYYADYFTGIAQGFNSEHINHFDPDHLHQVLVRSGFAAAVGESYIATPGYPCVWALAVPWKRDDRSRSAIERYTDRLNVQMAQVGRRLNEQLADFHGEAIAIWGAGQTAYILLEGTQLAQLFLNAATDTNPAYWGRYVNNCKIVEPSEFHSPPDVPILICSQLSQQAIVEQIKALGLTNRIITLD